MGGNVVRNKERLILECDRVKDQWSVSFGIIPQFNGLR